MSHTFNRVLICGYHKSNTVLCALSGFLCNLHNNLVKKTHFIDEETEAQKSKLTYQDDVSFELINVVGSCIIGF